jgi:uncharacterized protein Yka (UPF0111/DUF47 family)
MTQDDLKIYLSLAQFSLDTAELQSALAKMVLVRFQNLEDTRRMRAQLEQMPESEEKHAIVERLSAVEKSVDDSAETRLLKNFLSRAETGHEHMQAYLSTLRASLPRDSEQQ